MKHKITGLIIGLAAFALTAVTVQAGEINANEQSVISAVSQSFSYNGATYVVKSSYIAQGKAKLAEDEVDLSASQAQGYISQFHGSYQELVNALKEGRDEDAFRAAHTLKGVCLNLGFDRLYEVSAELTEKLRGRDTSGTEEMFKKVETQYRILTDAIREMEQ